MADDDADAFVSALLDRLDAGVSLRIGKITEVEATGNHRVRLDTNGGLFWAATDSDSTLTVGDRVWALQQDTIWVVGGRLSGGTGVPVGSVTSYAGDTPPDGWLVCDGSAVSRTTYAALFAVIGTTYGAGNGSTTFALPNLSGRTALGASGSHARAQSGGAETVTLSTAQLPSHGHSFSAGTDSQGAHTHSFSAGTDSQGAHTHSTPAAGGTTTVASGTGATVGSSGSGTTGSSGAHTHWVSGTTGSSGAHTHWVSGTTDSSGSGGSVSIMSPFLALPYIIRAA